MARKGGKMGKMGGSKGGKGKMGKKCGKKAAKSGSYVVDTAELVHAEEIPSGTTFMGTTVGGLSAITYDSTRNVYYMLADDRTGTDIRFYTATIDLDMLGSGSDVVTITDVTFMTRSDGSNFGDNDLDPEGLAYSPESDTLIMSSERDPEGIFEFNLDGTLHKYYNIPDYYLLTASGTFGTRNNNGLEGLGLTPDGESTLWAANEAALIQDGPRASLTLVSPARLLAMDPYTRMPQGREYIYYTDTIVNAPIPADAFADNGVTEIVVLDNKGQNMLVLERSFSIGSPARGYSVRLYEISTAAATNVAGSDIVANLPVNEAVTKKLVFDFGLEFTVGGTTFSTDNLEGLSLIYDDDCHEAILIVMSDDNFSAFGPQASQFAFLRLTGDF